MKPQILRLNKAGTPMQWICLEEAACFYAKEQVLWSIGDPNIVLHGGTNRMTGLQTLLEMAPVIATDGRIHGNEQRVPALSNFALFARDKYLCLYCGQHFPKDKLTRDHVIPRGLGGKDAWTNCVSACRPCNHHKGCRTPEQAGMSLIAVPFKPNKFEYLALANRHILFDQMEFLTKGFSRNMRQLDG